MLPLILAGASAIGGLIQGAQANKAAKAAAAASQVDIDALDARVRDISRRNAFQSAELERQLTPEVPQLRQTANQGLIRELNGSPEESAAGNALMGRLGQPVAGRAMSPLLMQAIERAKSNLALGGQLDTQTRNEVTRTSLANASRVGGGGLGLGRDVSARDLGLKSMDVENQRIAQAAQLGGMEQSAEEFNVGTQFNNEANLINQIQLLQQLSNGRFGRNLAAAQYGQSIAQPQTGLDPSSVADVVVGNANNRGAALSNQANIKGQQASNLFNLAGNMAGYGLLNYTRPSTPTSSPQQAVNPYPLLSQSNLGVANKQPFKF